MSNDTSHTDRFEELCAGYVLNSLDHEEQQEFQQMLDEASQDQLQTFHELRSAANQLAFTVERAQPSTAVKEQLMEKVQDNESAASGELTPVASPEQDEPTTSSGYNRQNLAMAASFALLLISLALVVFVFNKMLPLTTRKHKLPNLNPNWNKKKKCWPFLKHALLIWWP